MQGPGIARCFHLILTVNFLSIQVVEVNVKVEEPGKDNVHNNAFYAEEELLRSELQATRDCNPLSARHWIVRFISSSYRFSFCQETSCFVLPIINLCYQAKGFIVVFSLTSKYMSTSCQLNCHCIWIIPVK